MKSTGYLLAAVSAAGVLACAGAAMAQERTINDHVREQVSAMADPAEKLVGEIRLAELSMVDEVEFVFEIDPDKEYAVYGACDDDCFDLDLTAYDNNGANLAEDLEEDEFPILFIEPHIAGDHLHVVAFMADCETEVCVLGVGLYELK